MTDEKDPNRFFGQYNDDGSIKSRPEVDIHDVALGRGALVSDIRIKGTNVFISVAAGSAIDQDRIAELKQQAQQHASAPAKSTRRATKKTPDTPAADESADS